jgi:hypothetical protein
MSDNKQAAYKKLAEQLKMLAADAKKLAQSAEAVDKHTAEIEKGFK